MPFNGASLTAAERQMVDQLVVACRFLERMFWRQSDPDGLALYKSSRDPKLRRLLMINGSRYDLIDRLVSHPDAERLFDRYQPALLVTSSPGLILAEVPLLRTAVRRRVPSIAVGIRPPPKESRSR